MAPRKEKTEKSSAEQGTRKKKTLVLNVQTFADPSLKGSAMVLEYLRTSSPQHSLSLFAMLTAFRKTEVSLSQQKCLINWLKPAFRSRPYSVCLLPCLYPP
jgi:hypothetical protein